MLFGNIIYFKPVTASEIGALVQANDGLSKDSTNEIVQLGQSQGATGNPAKLLGVREIPMNGKRLFFVSGTFPVYNGAIGFNGFTIDVFNDGSTGEPVFHAFDGNNNLSAFLAANLFSFDTADGNFFQYDYLNKNWGTNSGGDASIISGAGLGANITKILDPTAAYTMVKSDFFILIFGTVPVTITLDPAVQKNQFFSFRNINTAQFTSTTFQLSSGLLYGGVAAAPVASILIGFGTGVGTFYSDGVDVYEINRA